jgi:hypothetical protein
MRSRARQWTVAILILATANACKTRQPPPSGGANDSGATTASSEPPSTSPRSTSSTSTARAADPHALSDAERNFGVSPTRSDAVTYQDDVVLMEQGAKAIRAFRWPPTQREDSSHPGSIPERCAGY